MNIDVAYFFVNKHLKLIAIFIIWCFGYILMSFFMFLKHIVSPDFDNFSVHFLVNLVGSAILSVLIFLLLRQIYKQKEIIIKLKENEAKFRLLFEKTPEVVSITNKAGEILECNEEALNFHKTDSKENLLKCNSASFYVSQEERKQVIDELLQQGYLRNKEVKFKTLSGEIKKALVSVQIMKLGNDEPLFISWHRDITDLKLKEEILREADERFRKTFDLSPVGSVIVGIDRRFILCNQAFADFLQYDPSELNGKTIDDVTHPEDQDIGRAEMAELMKGVIRTVKVQKRYLTKNDDIVWGEVSISLVRDENGNPKYFLPIIVDINNRILAEEALRSSEKLLQSVQKLTRVGGWEWDVKKQSMTWTDEVYRIHDIDILSLPVGSKEHINRSLECYMPEDRPVVFSAFQLCISEGLAYDMEFPFITFKGRKLWIRTTAEAVYQDGRIIKVIGNIMDITERKLSEITIKENERKLKELNSSKDNLFSIIAHDLKNPLGNFREMSRQLYDDYDSFQPDERKEFLKALKDSSGKLYILLENLLEWSRSQRGLIKFNPIAFNLYEFVQKSIDTQYLSAEKKNIKLVNSIPLDLEIIADQYLLATVIRNLLSNAVKYSYNNGTVKVEAGLNNGNVELSVSDTGTGISQDTLSKLFRIDVNIRNFGTGGEYGSGLGLILCKEFIEKHRGKITIVSEPGRGSKFTVFLPEHTIEV